MPGQEAGGCRLIDYEIDDVLSVEVASVTQEGLLTVVVIFRTVLEAPVEPTQRVAGYLGADGPAGKGAAGFLDVILGVVAHSHGEELQQLAAPVFINRAAVVAVVVQPEDHSGILRQLQQDVAELAEAAAAEHGDLLR